MFCRIVSISLVRSHMVIYVLVADKPIILIQLMIKPAMPKFC